MDAGLQEALDKLSDMQFVVGRPESWDDYPGALSISEKDVLLNWKMLERV